jgi:flagella basal body P-ring formation protein FlgA
MIRIPALALLALALPAATAAAQTPPFADRFSALDPVSAPPHRAAPALKASATVTGDLVRIGDLIENAGAAADTPIFRAPDLGHTGTVSALRIAELVLTHDIVTLDTRGLAKVVVTRASQAITPEDIEARIARALAGRQPSTDAGNLAVSFDSEVQTLHVEPGTELRLARMTFEPRSGRFDVVFERPGRIRSFIRFTGTYAETFDAAVLTRPLSVGEIVRAADVTTARRPKSELANNVISHASQAIGMSAKRALRPGQALRQSDLAKNEVIARNDNVTISYEVPGITLSMGGKALEGGAQGDVIGVLNVQSRRTIQATVTGPGHVVVVSPPRVTALPAEPRVAANGPVRPNPRPQPE